ncbi:endonuclease/exonuclease/phosphatase family protein [Micromonospora sp. NPDC050417]|uniref:endonuclease/exonuclease/phosphatase family protein n=1 Tax=Micromonospora sp. NPDC050417 TaxID=3364280 RepID=UPI00378FD30B
MLGGEVRGWSRWQRGQVLASCAVFVACLLVLHRLVPNGVGHLGSLLETFLPWLGLGIPALVVLSLLRRSVVALLAVLVPVTAWLGLFGGLLLPGTGSEYDLTAVAHNVSDENPDPAGTATTLMAVRPDLIGLAEVTPAALPAYRATLAPEYPHHTVHGTVGLWSRYPLTDARLVDIRPDGFGADWDRGLRATARTPWGDVAVYVAHLPSVRLGLPDGFGTVRRDQSAVLLGRALRAERSERVVLLGDLNSTVDDRGLEPVRAQLPSVGSGFAFSWPAALPVARIDQVMARAATITEIWSLPATGSDHLPIGARLRF